MGFIISLSSKISSVIVKIVKEMFCFFRGPVRYIYYPRWIITLNLIINAELRNFRTVFRNYHSAVTNYIKELNEIKTSNKMQIYNILK